MELVVIACRLLTTAVYGTRLRLYETSCAVEDVLRSDFTQVYVVMHRCCIYLIIYTNTSGWGSVFSCTEQVAQCRDG